MKKAINVGIAMIAAAALCGCGTGDEISESVTTSSSSSASSSSVISSSSAESSSVVSSSSEESSAESEQTTTSETSNETFLTGLAGDTVLKTDIKQIFVPDGADASIDNFSEENFSSVLCMGFIYASEPRGIFRTNLDNPDVYNDAEMSFSDITDEKESSFIRLNVGEKMCGMTLTFAETNFARTDENSAWSFPGKYFCYGSCEFSGEAELTGDINVNAADDPYNSRKGDITFIPTEGEIPVVNYQIPVRDYRSDPDGIYHALVTGSDKNITWANEYGSIYLGNIETDASAENLGIPQSSEYIKCRIVIDKLKYTASTQMFPRIEARIVSFSAI